jgi:hypothetical protein
MMTPCDSAAASFHVPVKSIAPPEEALALAEADETLALADALEAEAELEAAELAAEEPPDPPHATSARHAIIRQTTVTIVIFALVFPTIIDFLSPRHSYILS